MLAPRSACTPLKSTSNAQRFAGVPPTCLSPTRVRAPLPFPACLPRHVWCTQELDEQLYEECRQRYEQEQQLTQQKELQRQQEWQAMQQRAQKQATAKGLPNGVVDVNSTYTPILIRSKS